MCAKLVAITRCTKSQGKRHYLWLVECYCIVLTIVVCLEESSRVELYCVGQCEVLYVCIVILLCIDYGVGVFQRVKVNTLTVVTACCLPNYHVGISVHLLVSTQECKC